MTVQLIGPEFTFKKETMMKSLLFVLLLLSVTCLAQVDSLDRVELKDNKVFTGKVVKVTDNAVQFRETVTNLLHEFSKSEIKDLKLSNGVRVSFDEGKANTDKQNITGSSKTDNQSTNAPSQTTGSSKTQTENKGQTTQTTAPSNAAAAPASSDNTGGMDTSMIIVLAAGGLVALLLIGALLF